MGKLRREGRVLGVGKRFGSFLFFMYLFTKVLYIGTCISLIYIINAFIGELSMLQQNVLI